MLSTVIDRLTSLGSKYFVVGAFVPVLVFAFLNGILLYVEFDWFHDWADPQISGATRAFDVGAVVVMLAVLAYVLWSLKAYLADVLAGRHLEADGGLANILRSAQIRRSRTLRERYTNARNSAVQIASSEKSWTDALSAAALAGLKTRDAAGIEIDNTRNDYDGKNGAAAEAIRSLDGARQRGNNIPFNELKRAIEDLSKTLATNNIRLPHAATGNSLAEDRRDLLTLVQYAGYRWEAEEVELATELQWRFGARDVAATAFGNAAAALQSYGLTRYGINLLTFWSRLQVVLNKETELIAAVQDAKAQLDFFVSCCWLAALSTAVWGVVLPFWGSSVGRFLFVVLAGPVVARLFYLAAVENYIAFGELVRSSVDLHRLRLLDALHVRRPTSLRDERALWGALRRVTAFGQETIDIGYTYPPDGKA